jgi:hypothetical protein
MARYRELRWQQTAGRRTGAPFATAQRIRRRGAAGFGELASVEPQAPGREIRSHPGAPPRPGPGNDLTPRSTAQSRDRYPAGGVLIVGSVPPTLTGPVASSTYVVEPGWRCLTWARVA